MPRVQLSPFSVRILTHTETVSTESIMKMHQFHRRTFLRGVGVTMALPWMESLSVWGDEITKVSNPGSQAPVRLAVLFSGNGFHSKEWWAKGEGKQMELG